MTQDRSKVQALVAGVPRQRGYVPQRRSYSALQAIFDGDRRKVAYELFYRSSARADHATERTTAATLDVLQSLTGAYASAKRPGPLYYFLNITRDFLVGSAPLPTPNDIAVLEVQPDVFADALVRAGAGDMRARGFGISLDRYVAGGPNNHDALLQVASHVKLDLEGTSETVLRDTARLVRACSEALLVGARIGTPQLYDLARDVGCDLFQGYAVEGTEQQSHNTIRGSLAVYVEVLQLLADFEVNYDKLSAVIMRDPDLSLRILLACNAAANGLSCEITSIRQAVSWLGVDEVRRRVQLAIGQGLAIERTDELTEIIVCATLADLIGARLDVATGTGFLVGLLHQVAEALGMSLGELAEPLPLSRELGAALTRGEGPAGRALATLAAYTGGTAIPEPFTFAELAELYAEATVTVTGTMADLDGRAAVATEPAFPRYAHAPRQVGQSSTASPPPEPTSASPTVVQEDRHPHTAGSPERLPAPLMEPPPTDRELDEAREWNTRERQRALDRFLELSAPLEDLPGLLLLSREELASLVADHALAFQDVEGTLHLPLWQFASDGRPFPEVADLSRAFPGDAVSLSEWMETSCTALNGAAPIEELRDGRGEAVVALVKGIVEW
jgi:EAL and modified HD-GYP domain-containing signal transduction protein